MASDLADAIEIPQAQIDPMRQAGELLMPILKAGTTRVMQ